MTVHHFNTTVAKKYGVESAILIHNLMFWIQKNIANEKHFIDGNYWVYNSASAFEELFPYWGAKKIWRLLTKLEEKGVIESANHNAKQYDRTKWYSIIDKWIFQVYQIHFPLSENASSNNGTPIPNINTDIIPNTLFDETQYPFSIFWNGYDKKVGKEKCEAIWLRTKKLKDGKYLTEEEKELIIMNLPLFVKSKPDKQFRPNPLSYLNGRMWNDEIINNGKQIDASTEEGFDTIDAAVPN